MYYICIDFNCRFITWWKVMTFLDLKIYWFSVLYLYHLQLWVHYMVEGLDNTGSQNILIQCTISVLTSTVDSSHGGRPWHSWISKYTDLAYYTCIDFNCRFFTCWEAMTFLDLKIYYSGYYTCIDFNCRFITCWKVMTLLNLKIYWLSVLYLYWLQL